jgi:hypothetical protein
MELAPGGEFGPRYAVVVVVVRNGLDKILPADEPFVETSAVLTCPLCGASTYGSGLLY